MEQLKNLKFALFQSLTRHSLTT